MKFARYIAVRTAGRDPPSQQRERHFTDFAVGVQHGIRLAQFPPYDDTVGVFLRIDTP